MKTLRQNTCVDRESPILKPHIFEAISVLTINNRRISILAAMQSKHLIDRIHVIHVIVIPYYRTQIR